MSRTSVQTIVTDAVATALEGSGYRADDPTVQKAVKAVCEAVDAGLDTILTSLREGAENLGASAAQVNAIFTASGLDHDPEPVEETVPETPVEVTLESVAAQVAALQQQLNDALASAARQGFRI